MKSVMAHAVLAVFGLSFAYQTWTRTPEDEQPLAGEATILACEPSELASLELEALTHTVTVAPKRADDSVEYWITNQRKPPEPEPVPDAGVDAAVAQAADGEAGAEQAPSSEAAQPESKPGAEADAEDPDSGEAPDEPKVARPHRPYEPVTFLANKDKWNDLLKVLAPLRALRALGPLPESEHAQFGLDEVETKLRMRCGERSLALDIGARTYGSGDRYARDRETGQTYLIPGRIVSELNAAQYKFMQTDLHEFALSEVDEAVVAALGEQRQLLHRNRSVPNQARWVDAAEPDRRNELFNNWFQKLGRLKARAYLGPDDPAGADLQIEASPPEPVMTVEYRLEGEPQDKLELVRVDTEQGSYYYARSKGTRRWVTLFDSLAKQVEEDVALVVGAEQADAPRSESGEEAIEQDPHGAAPRRDPHAPFRHP